ncbi:MAG: hypothetical protein EU529_11455 [Promethearchaeota archaeon]|nr:MAG: hypothetical protein EU529_11455 [Candidatus Lokiarchaeota archaeon]
MIKDNNQGWGVVQGYAAIDALKEPIKIKQDTEIEISFDYYYNVFCQPIKLEPGHYFFELEQKDSAKAEIFLFDSEPDPYGEPILISHSINIFSNFKQLYL